MSQGDEEANQEEYGAGGHSVPLPRLLLLVLVLCSVSKGLDLAQLLKRSVFSKLGGGEREELQPCEGVLWISPMSIQKCIVQNKTQLTRI